MVKNHLRELDEKNGEEWIGEVRKEGGGKLPNLAPSEFK
jgi:hypothetical protein